MRNLLNNLSESLKTTESWVIFFLLGVIMMNFPFITIFDKEESLGGYPLLFLYLHGGWLVSIIVIVLFVRSISTDSPKLRSGNQKRQ